jgi:biotin transport system substrate-specific component
MSSTARTLTLADLAIPRAGTMHNVLLVLGAGLVTALAARIAVPLPWSPVPLTGQTFAVLLSGAVLGSRRGALAQALYVAQGALGLPVFAAGAAGLGGPTTGYLVAFPLAAFVTGALAERGWDRRFPTTVAAMLLGSAAIFAGGLAGLSLVVPRAQLLAAGLLPFVPGDVVKSLLAALVFPRLWSLARRGGNAA